MENKITATGAEWGPRMAPTAFGRLVVPVIAAVTAFLAEGCGTFVSSMVRAMPGELRYGSDMPALYPGIRTDVEIVRDALVGDPHAPQDRPLNLAFLPFALADFPLAAVVDTLLLPYDLWRWHRWKTERFGGSPAPG